MIQGHKKLSLEVPNDKKTHLKTFEILKRHRFQVNYTG